MSFRRVALEYEGSCKGHLTGTLVRMFFLVPMCLGEAGAPFAWVQIRLGSRKSLFFFSCNSVALLF